MGPTACGKSTLLNAMRLGTENSNSKTYPIAGARVAGTVLVKSGIERKSGLALARCIGFVPQEEILDRNLTVKELLTFNVQARVPSLSLLEVNEVILRAGKVNSINPPEFPTINKNRGFLQLSYFNLNKIPLQRKKETNLVETPLEIKKMIIWDILNLENINPNEDGSIGIFNGSVGLYTLKSSTNTTTKTFKEDTINNLEIGTNFSGPLEEIKFTLKTINQVSLIINNFISSLFTSSSKINDYPIRNLENFKNGFPFVVTPSKISYMMGGSNSTPTSAEQIYKKRNYNAIYNEIKIDNNFTGFFVVSSNKNNAPEYGTPIESKTNIINRYDWVTDPKSYGVLGSQKIYLLSQDSKSSKGFIDLQDTIYGISQDNFVNGENSIDSKTFSTIRGEELITLLEKIVSFLVGHVHNPVCPPDSVSTGNGVTVQEILKSLQEANDVILNQNIRIN
jgi:ABC-type sugar transport system ATPase subunit